VPPDLASSAHNVQGHAYLLTSYVQTNRLYPLFLNRGLRVFQRTAAAPHRTSLPAAAVLVASLLPKYSPAGLALIALLRAPMPAEGLVVAASPISLRAGQ
jgi:hypothetical protein